MNPVLQSERMVLDFDGWAGRLPQDQRDDINRWIDFAPEADRAGLKQRLASQAYVAEATGNDMQAVADRWDLVMPAFANEKGGEWLEAKTDPNKFLGLLKKDAQFRKDERQLLLGPDDEKAKDARQVFESSLSFRAQEAAYAGKSYAEAVGEWQAQNLGKPGYDPKRANAYLEVARGAHEQVAADLSIARPIAEQAAKEILTARDETAEGGDIAPFALFRGMTPSQKRLAFRVMAESGGGDKDMGQAWIEALGRGFENLIAGGGAARTRTKLLNTQFAAGDVVTEKDALSEVSRDLRAEAAERISGEGEAELARNIGRLARGRKLDEATAAQWNEQIKQAREDLDTAEELRKFGQELDSTKQAGGFVFQKMVLPVADSAAIMGSMMIPGGWAPAMDMAAQSYRNDEYARLSRIMDAKDADRLAGITGMAQAALDKLEVGILAKGISGTRRVLQQMALRNGTGARLAINAGGTFIAENIVEHTQDFIIPALVQDNLTSDPRFDVRWGEVWADVAKAAPDTALGMVLLSGVGGIAQTRSQSQYIRELSNDPAAMLLSGYSREQIAEIQAAPMEARGDLLAAYLPAKAPEGEARAKLVAEVVEEAKAQKAAFEAKQQAEAAASAQAADYAIRATFTAQGWQMTQESGATVTVDSAEAARVIREDLMQAATQAEADAFVALVESRQREGREVAVTGELVEAGEGGVTRTRGANVEVKEMSEQALKELHREAQLLADVDGSGSVNVIINGSNEIEFRQKVGEAAREVVQRIEVNQSESAAFTFLHESVEADVRTGIENGTITREEIRQAVASIAGSFDPLTARTPEERALRQRIQRVASGKADATELRETFSELATAEYIGRRKDGTMAPAGAVTAAVNAAVMNATSAAEVKALGKVRAFLRAVKQYFRAVFGTVAAIKKARREGGAAEFDTLIAKITGNEQITHDAAVADEISEYVEPTEEEREAGVAFRVSASNRLELVQKRLDAALARDPERRRDVAKRAADKLQTLAFNWETERWTTTGGKIRPVVEQRTKRELDKEQAVRQALREEELVTQGMSAMSPRDAEAYMQGRVLLEEHPLIQEMLGSVGRLMSRTEALRRGESVDEYDNAPWIPPTWYGGSIRPDEMAQSLADLGLIRDGYPGTMWDAIGKAIESQSKQSAAFQKAAKEVSDIQRQAREQAKREAAEWRAEQEAMQEKDWNPRQRLLRSLRTLDAILSAVPPEVRGKVGGFVKLASLSTETAQLEEINRRIDKLGELLEKHLQTETTEAMGRLLELAAPKREAGKQSRGKIGAEAHRYFDAVAAVMELSETRVEGRRAEIATQLADENLTPEQAAELFEQEQILDAFGAWEKKSAADMDAAYRAAREVYQTGRNRWRMIEEARLAEAQGLADQVIEALGGTSIAGIQGQKALTGAKLRAAGKLSLDLKSFAEVMDALLGRNHPLARRWSRAARAGFAQRNDEVRALRKRFRAALEDATGQRGLKARRALWDMANEQTIAVDTGGELVSDVQRVPISLIDEWIAGNGSPEALGFTEAESDYLMMQREAMEEGDRRELLTLDRTSRQGAESVKLTEGEALFLTMLNAQAQYGEALDKAGWTADVIASIESQLSEPAKKLRDFMRGEYRDGYAPLAAIFESMFGVSLPQIKNYAPAAFYHVGTEKDTGPLERGGVSGGMRAGFLANRKQHTAVPRLENAFATFFGHVNQSAHWKGLAPFVREFSAVLGKPNVKRAIESAHGKEMLKVLTDWVRNIEGNGLQVEAGFLDKAVSWLTSQQAYISLAYRLGTLMKQSTALLGAAYRMPARAYARGFAKLVTGNLDVARVFNSPVIQRRLETGFAPEARAAINDIWTAKPTRRAAILERGMELIGLTDAIFTTGSAAIAFDYHFNEAKAAGMSDEAAEAAAMTEVQDIIGRTAQPADVVDRSLFEARQGAFGRLLFMFASEARQKSSLWLSAWRNTLTGEATAEDARVLVISHLILAPMLQAITSAWRDARNDDDDELFDSENWAPLDFLKAIVAGPLAGLPLINEAVSGFDNAGPLGRFLSAFRSGKQLFEGPKENEAEKTEFYLKRIARIMQGADAFTGVAGSVLDQGVSLADNLLPDTESESAKKDRAARRREVKERKNE